MRKSCSNLSPSLTRRFPINDDSGLGELILINGGRWLLTASRTGSVAYYALDAREPVKRLLVQEELEYFPRFGCGVCMAVDTCNESALLSFNLALCVFQH